MINMGLSWNKVNASYKISERGGIQDNGYKSYPDIRRTRNMPLKLIPSMGLGMKDACNCISIINFHTPRRLTYGVMAKALLAQEIIPYQQREKAQL